MSNLLLLRGAMEGHEPAWRALYTRHHRATVAWLTSRARTKLSDVAPSVIYERAEEAVQEAWLALTARGVCETDVMPGLLMRIAIRAFWHSERQRVSRERVEQTVAASRPTVGSIASGATVADPLALPAAMLTDARLDAWVLRHVYKMSLKEVADELHLAHAHAAAAVLAKAKAAL